MNKKDLRGRVYGRLKVIAPTDKRRGNCVVWRCVCSCGNECEATTYALTHGEKRSCGCLKDAIRRNDIAGERRGRLTAIRPTDERYNGSTVWIWRCDCGNEVKKAIALVKRYGSSTTCPECARELKAEQAREMVRGIEKTETGAGVGYVKGIISGRLPKNNTSGARGVTWHKGVGKWLARINDGGKMRSLGYYDSFEEAVRAREKAVKRIYGEDPK